MAAKNPLVYHSVIINNKRYKMSEGLAQVTNVQLILDKLTPEEAQMTVIQAKKMRPGYSNHPVLSMLLNLIIVGASKKIC